MTDPGCDPGEVVEAAKQVMREAVERVVEPVNSRNEIMTVVFYGLLIHVGVTTAMLGAAFAYSPPERLEEAAFGTVIHHIPGWPHLYGLAGMLVGVLLMCGSAAALLWHRRWLATAGGLACTAWSGGHVAMMMTTLFALPGDRLAWSDLVAWAAWTGVCVLSTTALIGLERRL